MNNDLILAAIASIKADLAFYHSDLGKLQRSEPIEQTRMVARILGKVDMLNLISEDEYIVTTYGLFKRVNEELIEV